MSDDRRLPRWYMKAVWFTLFAVFVAISVWYVASRLTDLMITVAICFFLAFAIEPTVNRLARRAGTGSGPRPWSTSSAWPRWPCSSPCSAGCSSTRRSG
jgi:predicted PurR-regulated permease PerM